MQSLLWFLGVGALTWFMVIVVHVLENRPLDRQRKRKDELLEAYRIGLKAGWSIGYMDGCDDSNNECSFEVVEKLVKEKCPLGPLFVAQEMIDRGFDVSRIEYGHNTLHVIGILIGYVAVLTLVFIS